MRHYISVLHMRNRVGEPNRFSAAQYCPNTQISTMPASCTYKWHIRRQCAENELISGYHIATERIKKSSRKIQQKGPIPSQTTKLKAMTQNNSKRSLRALPSSKDYQGHSLSILHYCSINTSKIKVWEEKLGDLFNL